MIARIGGKQDIAFLAQSALSMMRETERRDFSDDVVRSGVEAILADERRGFYVVVSLNEQAIGSLLVSPLWLDLACGCYWWIQCVYVSPENRRRGAFEAMYKFVCDKARTSSEVVGVRLCVLGDNRPACDSYQKVGMERLPYVMFQERLRK